MTRHLRELKEKINAGRILLEDCKQNFYFMKEGGNMKFNIDDYPLESNVVMHCPTKEEASRFLSFLDSIGIRWVGERTLVGDNKYEVYCSKTAYCFTDVYNKKRAVRFSDVSWYEEEGYIVLKSIDFDFDSEEDDLCVCEEIGDFLNSLIAK